MSNIKIVEVKPPQNYYSKNPTKSINIFLAGSIEMDKAELWQERIIAQFHELDIQNKNIEEIVVYNPRRSNWDSNWKQSIDDDNFTQQVEWELEHIECSDIVIFYLQPGTKSPISLMELGIVSKDCFMNIKNVVVLCPEGFYRKGNVDVVSKWFKIPTATDMSDLLDQVKIMLNSHQI